MNAAGDAPVLRARGLRKEYGRDAALVRAVDAVDLDVAPGEALAVMGPSGCGKSTLLYLLGRAWAGCPSVAWPGYGARPSDSWSRPST
jgi:ABC-type glutathione transport system ATPase component